MSVKPLVFLLLSLTSKECLSEATGVSAAEPDQQGMFECEATSVSAAEPDQQGMFECEATGVSAAEPGQQGMFV